MGGGAAPGAADGGAETGAGARPLIGICAAGPEPARWSFWDQEAALVAESYLGAVRRAGGLPIALVPDELGDADVRRLIDAVDALLLIGGADLDPGCYGAPVSPRTERTTPTRDRFELAFVRAALARDIPVLGLCRGLQILNVAAGGSLHQHLLDEGFDEHRRAPGRLDEATHHEVALEPGSLVAAAASALRETVNSHHHQGVAELGEGGHVTGRSIPDGLVEAIEWPAQRYCVGVQWHPEALELSKLIATFVEAAAATPASLAA